MIGFSDELISWYLTNKRDLPWRNTKDPYKIWLSEVILQQTRVQQGLSYFYKFVEHFPTVNDLASATEEEVLILWQGLGYYSRARNMRKTAIDVLNRHQGQFPTTYSELLELKGIGPYTAAAVASFSANQPVAVVDGNVYRVLARIFGVYDPIDSSFGQKKFQALANSLLQPPYSTHNQAIMEFGALICTPKTPKCNHCVFAGNCHALANNTVYELPVKKNKTKVKTRYFNYLVVNFDQEFYLKKRQSGDIWEGLYDFPLIETATPVNEINQLREMTEFDQWEELEVQYLSKSKEYRHQLSHREIRATFWEINVKGPNNQSTYTITDQDKTSNYPVSQLMANYLADRKRSKQ